jgi:hypothetical protein
MVAWIPFQSRARSSKDIAVAEQEVSPNIATTANAIAAIIRFTVLLR